MEDIAALVGLVLALLGVSVAVLTGNGVYAGQSCTGTRRVDAEVARGGPGSAL